MKNSLTKDISAVLMTHGEGELVIPTLESFNEAVDYARGEDISVQKIITIDRPTKKTKRILDSYDLSDFLILELELGDLGRVRNVAASAAKGKYFAILDGDDFWSYNWLSESYGKCEDTQESVIVHPEINWLFGEVNNIFYHSDESDDYFDLECMRATNPWDSLCFCSTELILQLPYLKREIDRGYAYEDWNWNMRTAKNGIKHVVARDTIIFKRRRSSSQGAKAAARGVLTKPSALSYYDNYR